MLVTFTIDKTNHISEQSLEKLISEGLITLFLPDRVVIMFEVNTEVVEYVHPAQTN